MAICFPRACTMNKRKRHQKRQKIILLLSLFSCCSIVIQYLMKYSQNTNVPHDDIPTDLEDLVELRKSVRLENRDEFLETLLMNVSFKEVDLLSTQTMDQLQIYEKEIEQDAEKVVPDLGQDGEKAEVPPEMKEEADKVFKKEAFNRLLSEMIALDRRVPDSRELACQRLKYDDVSQLPGISVVIIFTNEAYISIIRMIHSLFNRTPSRLLEEIILVDDFSDHEDLMGKLEWYLATRFPVRKIRLVRLSKRSGLIRARMIGAHLAVGEVLVFLDAHCEAGKDWSEPLLQRIKEKRTTVVVPVIDVINENTLEYSKGNQGFFWIGGFKWSGHFYWISIPKYEEEKKKEHFMPTRTPTMAGGLFAIDRRYFWEMGSYDPGMEIWGAENLEMSFRIWQCGGSVETIPCSRVGHIFRSFRPYTFDGSNDRRNILRTASVWMDEYKSFVFQDSENIETGDISKRVAFRKRKNCKSFAWYLENIYKEKFKMSEDSDHWGQVRHQDSGLCLDTMGKPEDKLHPLEAYACHPKLNPSQTFYFSKNQELRRELLCARTWGPDDDRVDMASCDYNQAEMPHFKWTYNIFGQIVNIVTKKCLSVRENSDKVTTVNCTNRYAQKWSFDNYQD